MDVVVVLVVVVLVEVLVVVVVVVLVDVVVVVVVDVLEVVVLVVVVITSPESAFSQCLPPQPSSHSHLYATGPVSTHFPNSVQGFLAQSSRSLMHVGPVQPAAQEHEKVSPVSLHEPCKQLDVGSGHRVARIHSWQRISITSVFAFTVLDKKELKFKRLCGCLTKKHPATLLLKFLKLALPAVIPTPLAALEHASRVVNVHSFASAQVALVTRLYTSG